LLTVERLTVVAVLMMTTFAPEIAAPVESVTIPLTVPRLVCANPVSDRLSSDRANNRVRILMMPFLLGERIQFGEESNLLDFADNNY
jgi:hypothetical protein